MLQGYHRILMELYFYTFDTELDFVGEREKKLNAYFLFIFYNRARKDVMRKGWS